MMISQVFQRGMTFREDIDIDDEDEDEGSKVSERKKEGGK
jgi:hypothetical protein